MEQDHQTVNWVCIFLFFKVRSQNLNMYLQLKLLEYLGHKLHVYILIQYF